MWAKCAVTCIISVCLLFFEQAVAAAPADGHCSLPAGLSDELSRKYVAPRVVDLTDLSSDDRELFRKDHDNACPGLTEVDFYGDENPTWALVAIVGEGSKRDAALIVAHKVDRKWQTSLLDTANHSAAVVRPEAPGEYLDVYGEKTIRAKHPVIIFSGYNSSWAVLYAWAGKRVRKIWLRD
jgi:hypothetical protein